MAIVCMVNSTAVNAAAAGGWSYMENSTVEEKMWINQTIDDGCPVHNSVDSMKSAGYNVGFFHD